MSELPFRPNHLDLLEVFERLTETYECSVEPFSELNSLVEMVEDYVKHYLELEQNKEVYAGYLEDMKDTLLENSWEMIDGYLVYVKDIEDMAYEIGIIELESLFKEYCFEELNFKHLVDLWLEHKVSEVIIDFVDDFIEIVESINYLELSEE